MADKTYHMTNEQRKLAEDNIDLVKFAINKYLCSMPFDFEDMVSIGYYGLCRAAIGFNPNKNHTFSTYAIMAIVRTIRREIERSVRLKRGGTAQTISLNQSNWSNMEDEELIDFIVDNSVNVEEEAINKALCDIIWDIVPTYRELVSSGMTLTELGKLKGISKSAVSIKKKREFEKAKEYLLRRHITTIA